MTSVGFRQLWLQVSYSRGIARRYFVVNGFDGALTMLGLLTGFYLSETADLEVVIAACLGAAVALGVSGLTSAYLSETAERKRALAELEEAMVTDLSKSAPGNAARLMPLLIALVNGAAPLFLSLMVILPLWLARSGVELPLAPLPMAIATDIVAIFALGVFLGRVGGTSWLWGGIKSLLIAIVTVLIIMLLES
jgi:predicted membrane protein (TIGR00267 family)